MDDLWRLLADNTSTAGRAVTSFAVVVVAVVAAWLTRVVVSRRIDDAYARYYARKIVRFVYLVIALIALAIVWRAFAGRFGVVLGLAAAGIAFAMQEVIGAVAGFFNILSGRIFRVGDRIEMGGVRGDVIDITPLRTKIMEMGSGVKDGDSWVKGRQYTGRIVAVSNKMTFTEPVFNYSSAFDFLWEELTIPVPHEDDWQRAEHILQEEIEAVSSSGEAKAAIRGMATRYPIERADVAPRVYVRVTDNWTELSARFIVPVRTARLVKDELTRSVVRRLDEAGISIASQTSDVTVHLDEGRKDSVK